MHTMDNLCDHTWTPRCADPWCQSRRPRHSKVSDTRVCGHPSVGTADGCPITGRCRLLVNCAVSRVAGGQVSARAAHSGVCNFTARPPGVTTMQTDAYKMGRDERRALLEQRRAVVVRQLRRLAIELNDLDRQLDEIKQSER